MESLTPTPAPVPERGIGILSGCLGESPDGRCLFRSADESRTWSIYLVGTNEKYNQAKVATVKTSWEKWGWITDKQWEDAKKQSNGRLMKSDCLPFQPVMGHPDFCVYTNPLTNPKSEVTLTEVSRLLNMRLLQYDEWLSLKMGTADPTHDHDIFRLATKQGAVDDDASLRLAILSLRTAPKLVKEDFIKKEKALLKWRLREIFYGRLLKITAGVMKTQRAVVFEVRKSGLVVPACRYRGAELEIQRKAGLAMQRDARRWFDGRVKETLSFIFALDWTLALRSVSKRETLLAGGIAVVAGGEVVAFLENAFGIWLENALLPPDYKELADPKQTIPRRLKKTLDEFHSSLAAGLHVEVKDSVLGPIPLEIEAIIQRTPACMQEAWKELKATKRLKDPLRYYFGAVLGNCIHPRNAPRLFAQIQPHVDVDIGVNIKYQLTKGYKTSCWKWIIRDKGPSLCPHYLASDGKNPVPAQMRCGQLLHVDGEPIQSPIQYMRKRIEVEVEREELVKKGKILK